MIRVLVGLAMALFTMQGRAGILRCTFTEPFITVTLDSTTHKVSRVSADANGKGRFVASVISKSARIERTLGEDDERTFEVSDEKGIILTLRLDGRGSDGMSDAVFPFRADYHGQEGGCDTVKYPRWNFDDMLENLHAPR